MKIEITKAKEMKLVEETTAHINRGVDIKDCDEFGYGRIVDLIVKVLNSEGFVADIKLKKKVK